MQIYDAEAELSSGGIFELVYERFVVKNLTKRESWTLNIKKTQNNFLKIRCLRDHFEAESILYNAATSVFCVRAMYAVPVEY